MPGLVAKLLFHQQKVTKWGQPAAKEKTFWSGGDGYWWNKGFSFFYMYAFWSFWLLLWLPCSVLGWDMFLAKINRFSFKESGWSYGELIFGFVLWKILMNRKPFCTYKHRMPAEWVQVIRVDGHLELQSLTVMGRPMIGKVVSVWYWEATPPDFQSLLGMDSGLVQSPCCHFLFLPSSCSSHTSFLTPKNGCPTGSSVVLAYKSAC